MNVETVVALCIAGGAIAVWIWWYAGRNARRATELQKLLPLPSPDGPRPVVKISDALPVAESLPPDASDYAAILRQLVDECGRLAGREELLARSNDAVAAAENVVAVSARRIEALNDATFAKGLRTSFAASRLRRAEGTRDTARTEAARVQTDFSDTAAKVQQLENAAATARAEWERGRVFREKKDVLPVMIEQNTLLVMFFDTATPKAIAALLKRYRLEILSGIASLSLFVVRQTTAVTPTSDDGHGARLRALAGRLRNESLVEAAAENMQLEGATVSAVSSGAPVSGALERSHFPEAADFNRRAGATGPVDVGVLDIGFGPTNELSITALFGLPLQEDSHGTEVASIIAANPDNGIGIAGAAPFANIIAVAPQGALFDEFISLLESMLKRRPELRVINASVAYNWGSKGVVPRNSPATQEVVANMGKMVRKAMRAAPRTVLVAAAGNDCRDRTNCNEPATWASPYNWAALGPESPEDVPQSVNVLVVEGLNAAGTDHLPMSNTGGTIAAIGEGVLAVADSDVVTRGDGTSASTALVTSAIAWMLQLNSRLTVAEIRTNLGIGSSTVPKLNAFDAVRRSAGR